MLAGPSCDSAKHRIRTSNFVKAVITILSADTRVHLHEALSKLAANSRLFISTHLRQSNNPLHHCGSIASMILHVRRMIVSYIT